MKLNFDEMQEVVSQNLYGGEKEVAIRAFKDEQNKILRGRLIPGASLGRHTHETNSEIIYIVSGCGKMLINDGEERLEAGTAHYCPKGQNHGLMNDGTEDLIFFAVVAEQ